MAKNLVSMIVTAQPRTTALAALGSVEAPLVGLISLEPDDRKSLTRMGPKSDTFARGTIRVLAANAAVVPPGLNVTGAQADLAALDMLLPIADALQRLNSRVQDTVAALGHDVMDVALDGYALLKVTGDTQGLVELRKDLGSRFARARRKEEEGDAIGAQ